MKLSDNKKSYTFMVFPHDLSGKPITFSIPYFIARYILIIILVLVSLFGFSLLYSAFISGKLVHYKIVVAGESEKNKQIDHFLLETGKIEQELQFVLDQNNQLRKTLGLKINKTKIDLLKDKTILKEETNKKKPYGLNFKLKKISSALKLSLKETKENKTSLEELKNRVKVIQSKLAAAPSTWPISGPLVSSFGYRRYPWRGMHTGVDIKASYGAPIRATASGRVIYAGWRQGYGKTVEIDHGNGFTTLYGHASQIIAFVGEKITKGQIISYVGTTGYTTGPHLHYEVRKYDVPINPVAFLNLNILSAGRYF